MGVAIVTNNSLYGSSIFTALRDGRVGVQCERSLRFLLFLLEGWSRHTEPRKLLYSKPDHGVLSAIYFDKLAMLSFRIWDAMFQTTREQRENEDASITFPSPFVSVPGKHGPGPGRVEAEKGDRAIYLIEILFMLQKEGILNYFQVTPPEDEPQNHKHYKTTITPGLPVTDDDEFLRGFKKLEREVLLDLRNTVKRLGPAEIRALGTHSDYQSTVDHILLEFTFMASKRERVTDAINQDRSFIAGAQELLEFSNEALRKSKTNREDYATARHKAISQINHPILRSGFEIAQESTDTIWPKTSKEMVELVKRSEDAVLSTKYLCAVAELKEYRSSGVKTSSKLKRPKKS